MVVDTPPRSYWDQTIVEDLLSGRLYNHGLRFDHREGRVGPAGDRGAVVVVPGRSHAGHEHEVAAALAELPWVLLIVTGDEERRFRWQDISHPRMRVWVQTPDTSADAHADGFLPVGWSPPVRDWLGTHGDPADVRPLWWAFLGQVTHQRRREAVWALEAITDPLRRMTSLVKTDRFLGGVLPEEYVSEMSQARFAPCPSGPVTVDTFRASEAFELGCVPLLDLRTPHREDPGYWPLVAGSEPPVPMIDSWADVPVIMAVIDDADGWYAAAVQARAWWGRVKARWAETFARQVRDLASIPDEVDDLVTVVMSVSPIQDHPATAMIEETIRSVRWHLPRAKIVLACDGVRPEQADLAADYREHLLGLLRWAHDGAMDPPNIVVHVEDVHRHQALTTKAALDHVRTPLLLFVEHDTPLAPVPIHWPELVRAVFDGTMNVVRFHHEADVHPEHRWLMVDVERRVVAGAPVMQTMQWSQRPHLADAGFYRAMLRGYFGENARTMIEDTMHGVLDFWWREHGRTGADRWRVFLYAPEGSMVRSYHMDGRGDAPKYDMVYEYPDNDQVPEGAPHPTSRRSD